jgi:shikimate kinase
MRIFLVGFMGCGKSKKGKKIAAYLGLNFIDMDDWIEKAEGLSISDVFKIHGEDYFRQTEFKALNDIIKLDNVVIATGGGSPCYFNAIDLMNNAGSTIYLKANSAFLVDRLLNSKKKRPLIEHLSGKELYDYVDAKLKAREEFYKKSKITVEALGCRAIEIANLIKEQVA